MVLVMAFPPAGGDEAAGTLECGNAGPQGEHPQKHEQKRRIFGISVSACGA
jgi:hypothetical protein